MTHETPPVTLYGLMAEFDHPKALVDAADQARLAGYRRMDAYTPIPIEELSEALGLRRTRLPLLVLLGGSPAVSEDSASSTGCRSWSTR